MILENLSAFLEDFGVDAEIDGFSPFLVLLDKFHSRMDIGIEGRSIIATAKSEDIEDIANHGTEITIEGKTYEIVGIRPLDDGQFTELDLKE
jgi:hypothetical protein